jgi:hypothetical protein
VVAARAWRNEAAGLAATHLDGRSDDPAAIGIEGRSTIEGRNISTPSLTVTPGTRCENRY